ncbi:MAG TPA: response regulator transcription factor [Bryobacteraceae bacterium]|nr:response regulator transcription factor [Bryobacteraceae bacterium]
MKASSYAVPGFTEREPSSGGGGAASISLLIAEESSLFRDGLANLLASQQDFRVTGVADSAASAVEQIRASRPDIILLGWPASSASSQRIFASIQDGKKCTRVIMLTDGDAKEDFVEAVKHGCCGIVPKQTSTELLLKSIRKVYAGEFWLDRLTTAEIIRRLAKRSNGANGASSRLGVRDQSGALSQREREIVVLVAQGYKNKEMAERMFISEQTVKNHLHNIFDKLGVSDRLELALYAIHHNLHESA